jgi:hypothetical protein
MYRESRDKICDGLKSAIVGGSFAESAVALNRGNKTSDKRFSGGWVVRKRPT